MINLPPNFKVRYDSANKNFGRYLRSKYEELIRAAMVQEAPLKIYARGVVSYFYFSRAPRARAENQANQPCHCKSSRCRMEQLDTESCRGTVPLEPPMPNCSMRHREPTSEIDDTGQILQGASCPIAADLNGRQKRKRKNNFSTSQYHL
jgi:hypothetical protein